MAQPIQSARSIALIGPSGAGKSTIGRLLARRLGWSFVDLDALIADQASLSIAEIFEREGESGFRDRESVLLVRTLEQRPAVIACGGGVVVRTFNRLQLREYAWCVFLTGNVAVLAERLLHDTANPRPLLESGVAERLAVMLGERRALYSALASWTVHTDALSTEAVVEDVLHGWRQTTGLPAAMVAVTGGMYQVCFEPLESLPQQLDALELPGACWVVTDSSVGPLYGAVVLEALRQSGRTAQLYAVPAGEPSKSQAQLFVLYTWLLEQGVQRQDVVLALGGGVVGDLAGFVAATTLRGVAVVQLPTTVLSMIDSAIGGKTGINHPRGKNLVGAFHQPRLVLCDPRVLTTLPRSEAAAGWAEAIKHGVIADAALFDDLETAGATLLDLPASTHALLARAAAVKIGVVNRDEREQHERMLLNYGHTLGQAVEAATGYGRYLHGEAVAIGMAFAGELAARRGLWSRQDQARQDALLAALGLPLRPSADLDPAATLAALHLDKKRAAGTVRWILPSRIGAAAVYTDVPFAEVEALLYEWLTR